MAEVTEIRLKSESGERARVYLDGVYWLSARAEEPAPSVLFPAKDLE